MAQRQVDERPDHTRPPPTKASRGGRIRLRYHGDSPLISPLVKQGLVEAVAYPQSKVFEAAVQFARTEGVLPAPGPAHAVRAVVDEALRCKEQGLPPRRAASATRSSACRHPRR